MSYLGDCNGVRGDGLCIVQRGVQPEYYRVYACVKSGSLHPMILVLLLSELLLLSVCFFVVEISFTHMRSFRAHDLHDALFQFVPQDADR